MAMCARAQQSFELQELRHSGTESEDDCFNTEYIYSGDSDDGEFGGPGNHQDITINISHGPSYKNSIECGF